MIGDSWSYPSATYCFVNTWQFSCTDPNGNDYTYVTSLVISESTSGSGSCPKFNLSELASMKISASSSTFSSFDEGTFTLSVKGWMAIDSTKVS